MRRFFTISTLSAASKGKITRESQSPESNSAKRIRLRVACVHCGKLLEKHRMPSHIRFNHTPGCGKLGTLRECNDPTLAPLIVDGKFSCPHCDCSLYETDCKWLNRPKLKAVAAFRAQCARHLYKKHGILCPNISFPCPVESCSRVLFGRSILNCHRKKVHGNPTPKEPCPICGKEMTHGRVKAHLKEVHGVGDDESKEPCPICGKTFTNSYYMAKHMLTHSGKKTYQCEWCDHGVNNLECYRHHVFTRHGVLSPPEAKVHRCTECEFASTVRSRITLHMRVHNSEDLVSCPESGCGRTFKWKALLTKHIDRVHRRKDANQICKECDEGEDSADTVIQDSLKTALKYFTVPRAQERGRERAVRANERADGRVADYLGPEFKGFCIYLRSYTT